MKVLVTGGNGMVGKNLKETIPSHVEALYPTSTQMNLLDKDLTLSVLREFKPDFVIHSAGRVGGIQANIAKPVEFLTDNAQMGINLVSACHECGVEGLINLSSSCIYPKDLGSDLSEDKLLTGALEPTNEGYALAKIIVLKLIEYYNYEYNTDYKTLIPCNLYGRWDSFEKQKSHLVPAIIQKMILALQNGDDSVEIWGDGEARREFMYAADLTEFIWGCLDDYDKIPNIMNVGLGYDYSINDYYKSVAEILEYKGEFVHDLSKPVGMRQKLLNVDKQSEYGWEPKNNLKEGLSKTINFYRNEL